LSLWRFNAQCCEFFLLVIPLDSENDERNGCGFHDHLSRQSENNRFLINSIILFSFLTRESIGRPKNWSYALILSFNPTETHVWWDDC
jgi:hypothetical protein